MVKKEVVIYNDTKLELGKAKRVGTLGKTKVTSKKYGIINNTKNIKSIAKKYNIKLTKEEDRLVFSGRLKRKNNVNIILYKNLKSNYYKVKVSKHPYTALCVDIFTEEENKNGINITKYINIQFI